MIEEEKSSVGSKSWRRSMTMEVTQNHQSESERVNIGRWRRWEIRNTLHSGGDWAGLGYDHKLGH